MLKVKIASFSYAEIEILHNISFQLKAGEHLAVLGESGCGKSTLLHLIYGLLNLDQGEILWFGEKLRGPKYNLVPGEDFIKLVAQEYNIMPFTTVSENIATFLPRVDEAVDQQRITELLEVVEMTSFAHTKVKNLSGGQKQRVALAKALANEPKLLLLDEPFSHIDSFRKNKLRRNLFTYLKKNDISCITATHDADEALAFSDQLLIIKEGTVAIIDTPHKVYQQFADAYQASFFGEVNVIPSSLLLSKEPIKELYLLPHQLKISEEKTALHVVIEKSYFKGSHYLIQAKMNELPIFFNAQKPLNTGHRCYLKL